MKRMLTDPEWRAVEQDRLREAGMWSPWAWRAWSKLIPKPEGW